MSNQAQLPTCSSCNRPILPGEKAVRFACPECGEITIWRCEKCRQFSRSYKCINCG
ncbi:MAG: zinc finger domain-containing protein, partial [Nitrososphaerales archaeon]